jgi:two-component system sensor histidine kinase DesK
VNSVQRLTRIGRYVAAAAAVFVVPSAVSVAATGLGPWQVGLLFGFFAWGAVWIWLWLRACGRGRPGEVVGLVGITVILVMFSLIQPQPAGTFLVFSFIVAGVLFPLREAVWWFVGLLVLQIVLLIVRLADPAAAFNSLINSVFVGVVTVGGRLLWGAYSELLDARQEIARLAVSEERLRFARDVHDILGQSLATIVLKSELIGRQLPDSADESLRHEIDDVARIGRKSLNDLREAVSGYRMPTLPGEVTSARAALRAAGIALAVDDRAGGLPAEQDSVLAWCLREAVTNVVKHSGAQRCEVSLSRDNGFVRLSVADDGRGAESLDGGSGLAGMRERVARVGGTFEVGAREKVGIAVRVAIPAGAAPEPHS